MIQIPASNPFMSLTGHMKEEYTLIVVQLLHFFISDTVPESALTQFLTDYIEVLFRTQQAARLHVLIRDNQIS